MDVIYVCRVLIRRKAKPTAYCVALSRSDK